VGVNNQEKTFFLVIHVVRLESNQITFDHCLGSSYAFAFGTCLSQHPNRGYDACQRGFLFGGSFQAQQASVLLVVSAFWTFCLQIDLW
jgi:hypothetical protein